MTVPYSRFREPILSFGIGSIAKGVAGGFPFGAFALSEAVAKKLEIGDHGGTYCGNPLGCSVSYAVITHLMDNNISRNVEEMGYLALN